ncbi:MAG: hypothetical protein E6R04_11160 [Spirochaetes bacterium]|nr:MAG: hypothetical protein E6R04_11160 [Spirochaetota bacterium]
MKVKRSEIEQLVRESIHEELENLSEEELQELLGGLKGMFGAAGQGIKQGAQRVAGAAQAVGQKVAGAAQQAGQAVAGAAGKAAGAVKGAYQAGETSSAMQSVSKGIQGAIATVDKAIPTVSKTDPNAAHTLNNVKAGLQSAADALTEGKKPSGKSWKKKVQK